MSKGSVKNETEDVSPPASTAPLATEVNALPGSNGADASLPSSDPATDAATTEPAGLRSRWQELSMVSRRLIIWGAVVLTLACLARGASTIRVSRGTRQQRFEKFVSFLARQLPVILYGETPVGQEIAPHEVKIEYQKLNAQGIPSTAEIRFHEVASSSSGLKLITRYRITYDWRDDYWHCSNLNCVVERPELSKLDRMNFNAVMEQESAEKAQHLANSRRRLAEEQLSVHRKLGKLLRSGNQF